MKKPVIAFAVLSTIAIILLVLNLSKSQTIDKLNSENNALKEKVTNIQTQLDDSKTQLEQAIQAQNKQQEQLKTMSNVIAHNEQLRDQVNMLKQKLAKMQASKASSAAANKAKPASTSSKIKK